MQPLASKFDSIVIGFNKSELQSDDVRWIEAGCPQNVQTVIQAATLTPPNHLAALVERVETDYVMFLCHDDYLLEDGVAELRELINERAGQKIAVFGSHRWGESESSYCGITRELLAYPDGADVAQFLMADMDHAFTFSLSGLVSHVGSLRENLQKIRIFHHGFRADNMVITVPGIERVFQTNCPLVEIRLHPHQEGRQPQVRARIIDNMTYYFIHALHGRDDLLVKRAVRQTMAYAIHARRPFVLFYLARLLFASIRWPGPKNYWMCVTYLVGWVLTATSAKFRNVFSKRLLGRA